MPATQQVAHDYYQQQRAITAAAVAAAVQQWEQLDENSLTESWLAWIGRVILALITQAQRQAAEKANPYLTSLAAAQGVGLPGAVLVSADAFAGIASDGRPLDSLLYTPIVAAKRWIGEGRSVREAMGHGRNALALIASTQVADAGRAAVGAGMTAHREYVSYVRHLTLPSCARCIILAGREYSWSTGFQRHPGCDCVHVGVVRDAVDPPKPLMPDDIFGRLSEEQQNKVFGRAGAQAIRDGADIGQVVNARRGMQVAGGRKVTTEGMTRRGIAGRRAGARGRRAQAARPMPEQIYKDAGGDRDQAIDMLKRFGYIT